MLTLQRSSWRLLLGVVLAAAVAIAVFGPGRDRKAAAPAESRAPAGEAARPEAEGSAPLVSLPAPTRAADTAAEAPQSAGAKLPARASAVFVVEEAERFEPPDGGVHEHRLQYWRGRISPPVEDWAQIGLAESTGVSLSFALPDGETVPVVFKRFERYDARKGVYIASVEGRPFAEAMFSYVNDAVSGVLRFPDQGVSWEIRNAGGGAQYFEQVDLSKLGECAACKRE